MKVTNRPTEYRSHVTMPMLNADRSISNVEVPVTVNMAGHIAVAGTINIDSPVLEFLRRIKADALTSFKAMFGDWFTFEGQSWVADHVLDTMYELTVECADLVTATRMAKAAPGLQDQCFYQFKKDVGLPGCEIHLFQHDTEGTTPRHIHPHMDWSLALYPTLGAVNPVMKVYGDRKSPVRAAVLFLAEASYNWHPSAIRCLR